MSAFGEGSGKLVAHDATMQGGVFAGESPYTLAAEEVSRFVLRGSFGLRIALGSSELRAARTFITREFVTGRDHGWGGFVFSYQW